jgi:predicted membrane channel-forming protein YqfA (hemolysin III family)
LIGTLAFGLLIEHSGFVLAGILVVFVSRFADRDFRALEVSLLAVGLVAFIAGLFRFGLGLPLKLLPF